VRFDGRPPAADGSVAASAPLSAWPLPYRGGALHLSFAIPTSGEATEVALLDLAGRHVRTLTHGAVESGRQVMAWDGRDDSGRNVPDGVYFLVTRTEGHESRLKLVVLR
jgi:flagellar basal-body rod modification protein FlgD